MVKPDYKQTDMGTLPENWEIRPLLDAVSLPTGQVDPRVEPYRSMILIAPDHIQSRTGRLIELKTASEQNASSGKFLFKPGDIVYSKIRPYLRKAILARFSGLCSADMYPLTPHDDVEPAFMLAVLLGPSFSLFAETVSMRSGIPKINREELAEYNVLLPPLEEQRAIAEALGDVDELLAALERLIAKKRDVKTAVMQQLLTGEKRLPGFTGRWENLRVEDFGEIVTGGTPPTKDQTLWDGLIPWMTPTDISYSRDIFTSERTISLKGLRTIRELPANTVLVTCIASIGKNAILKTKGACNQQINAVIPKAGFSPEFLYYLFENSKPLLLENAGITATLIISKKAFSNLRFSVPDALEQQAIAGVLGTIDDEISALKARHAKTQAIKQGMMQELLTGRTRLV